jgi:hypothetical protein
MTSFSANPSLRLRLGGAFLVLAAGALLAWYLIDRPTSPPGGPGEPADLQPTPGLPWFVEVTPGCGIDFQHFDSATPMHYIHESMGSGIAWIDYNNDGWPDLFCVQAGPVRPSATDRSLPGSKLYRNNGDGTFTDVTSEAGLDHTGLGMGCAVGDYDNDGCDDLVVTYVGEIVLYHNEPDGKGGRHFVDVTARAGLHNPHWCTGCAWGDIDGDGCLDLYVCNYVEVDFDNYPDMTDKKTGLKVSANPVLFKHVAHQLYHNNGDGTFRDVSISSGVAAAPPAPGLGVVLLDLDGDGRIDIYVANDLKPAYLFHNQGGGKFVEKGLPSGAALEGAGNLVAGMGVEAGDLDGSGRPSLFVTNFQASPSMFFRNQGGLLFQDWSYPSGLGAASLSRLGFGCVLLDADLDGRLDLAVANGHINRHSLAVSGHPTAQEAQLFLGDGKGLYRDVSAKAGTYFRAPRLGRGLAYADFDNDGRPDLAYSNNAGRAALLRNQSDTGNNWIRLELEGAPKKSNRNAIGARVEVEAGGKRQVHFVKGGGSYLSASERRLLIGLGPADQAERVTVFWPSGAKQAFRNLQGRRWWRLHEGQADAEAIVLKRRVRSEGRGVRGGKETGAT